MLIKCKKCGAMYESPTQFRAYCDTCRHEIKSAVNKQTHLCTLCGTSFTGSPRAKYCPTCRIVMQKEQKKVYIYKQRNNLTRPLGSTDKCTACGKDYIVKSGLQRYCPDCAKTVVWENVNSAARSRMGTPEAITRNKEQEQERLASRRVCLVCGKTYTPRSHEKTCSQECWRKRKNAYLKEYEKKKKAASKAAKE